MFFSSPRTVRLFRVFSQATDPWPIQSSDRLQHPDSLPLITQGLQLKRISVIDTELLADLSRKGGLPFRSELDPQHNQNVAPSPYESSVP